MNDAILRDARGQQIQKGDVVVLDGQPGVVNYIGARGHIGVDMDNGKFRVVLPSEVRRA